MKNQEKLSWDDIKAMNAETSKMLKEDRKQMREDRKRWKEEMKQMKEDRKQWKEDRKQWKERMELLDKQFAKTREQIGGISRSNGGFCEEYFVNSFKENPIFLGEKYDRVLENHKPLFPVIEDEYDLVLLNGSRAVLIEVKYKAGMDDVGKTFSKLHTYRTNYPMFKDYKIYLGLASFSFSKAVRNRAAKKGVILIQQRGDKIEIVSENIRAW